MQPRTDDTAMNSPIENCLVRYDANELRFPTLFVFQFRRIFSIGRSGFFMSRILYLEQSVLLGSIMICFQVSRLGFSSQDGRLNEVDVAPTQR